ncbi:MAG TPA: LuxR C-terminal-related transcriptional regulator [Geothrix sp.]|nr:LuxR C-terminal-related transcriptional regulator [Geothrix sp.]
MLTFLLALAAGLISLTLVSSRSQHHFSPVTQGLVSPLLFYNLWILVWLVFQYVDATVLPALPPSQGRLLVAGLIWLSMVICIQWGATYLAFTLSAINRVPPVEAIGSIRKAAYKLVGSAAVLCLVLLALHQEHLIRPVSRALNSLTFLTVAILSIRFWLGTRRRTGETSSRKLGTLAGAYSLIFTTLALLVLWNRFSASIPPHRFVILAVSLEMTYNLVTMLWIHAFDPTAIATISTPVPTSLEKIPTRSLTETYGISKREGEVIQLVCQGRTNQEIADTLFISLKTVKDHNYRIFQKTGVRNRVELTQLVRGLPPEAEPQPRSVYAPPLAES